MFVCVKTGFFLYYEIDGHADVVLQVFSPNMYLPCAKDVRLRKGFDLLCNVNF